LSQYRKEKLHEVKDEKRQQKVDEAGNQTNAYPKMRNSN